MGLLDLPKSENTPDSDSFRPAHTVVCQVIAEQESAGLGNEDTRICTNLVVIICAASVQEAVSLARKGVAQDFGTNYEGLNFLGMDVLAVFLGEQVDLYDEESDHEQFSMLMDTEKST